MNQNPYLEMQPKSGSCFKMQ